MRCVWFGGESPVWLNERSIILLTSSDFLRRLANARVSRSPPATAAEKPRLVEGEGGGPAGDNETVLDLLKDEPMRVEE